MSECKGRQPEEEGAFALRACRADLGLPHLVGKLSKPTQHPAAPSTSSAGGESMNDGVAGCQQEKLIVISSSISSSFYGFVAYRRPDLTCYVEVGMYVHTAYVCMYQVPN